MQAHTIAGLIGQFEKLVCAANKEQGAKSTVMVEGIDTEETGRIQVKFLIARQAAGVKKRKTLPASDASGRAEEQER